MLSGVQVGHGVAKNPCGGGVHFQLIKPYGAEPGASRDIVERNLQQIEQEQDRWGTDDEAVYQAVRQIDHGVTQRSHFSTTVLKQVHDNVDAGICCALVAQADDGRVLGAMTYFLRGSRDLAIGLLAIEPASLAGTPGKCQLRGIGTAMVAAVSRQALAHYTDAIVLHPLDSAAERFWRGRGFTTCADGLCVVGAKKVEALINGCEVEPDCPDRGQCVVCGESRTVPISWDTERLRKGILVRDTDSSIGPITMVNSEAGGYLGFVRLTPDGSWEVASPRHTPASGFESRERAIDVLVGWSQ